MRKILIALMLIAASAFIAAPAVAEDGTDGSTTETSSETPAPAQEEAPPPAEETTPPPETPAPSEETTPPSSEESSGSDQSSGSNQPSGNDQSSGPGQSSGTEQTPATEQSAAIGEALEAGQVALDSLLVVLAAPEDFKVFICHYPPGEPDNPQFIEIGNPAVLAAHLKNHDGDFVANSASDCPGSDPQDPEDDRKVTICHFPESEQNPVEFIEISVNALQAHLAHGDFLADSESDCSGDPGEEDQKVTICHFPPGNPDNVQFIEISVNALQAHLDHGDFVADSKADCFSDDDDDDGDDDGDHSDDEHEAALPDTGGPSQSNLVLGVLLTVLGVAIFGTSGSIAGSITRTGLFGLVPAYGPSEPWPSAIALAADLPVTVVKPEWHPARWTALGATALIAVAVFGRSPKK